MTPLCSAEIIPHLAIPTEGVIYNPYLTGFRKKAFSLVLDTAYNCLGKKEVLFENEREIWDACFLVCCCCSATSTCRQKEKSPGLDILSNSVKVQ